MDKKQLKIWHTADIQIEVRNNAQRYSEFNVMLDKLVQSAKGNDIAVLAGDLTEFATPNEVERKLLIAFVNTLASVVTEVVIIKGNHDIVQQQSRNTYLDGDKKVNIPDAIDILAKSFPTNVLLCTESRVYKSNFFRLQYVVWNQKHKYELEPKFKYNPLENDEIDPSIPAITLFHDCIKNAINFDGKLVRGSNDKPEYLFGTNLILAGDIHCPAIIEKNGQTFTYCSSPVERDFGEGDYFINGKLVQNGSSKHGYNTIVFDCSTQTGKVTFHQLEQYANFQTLIFDRNFDIEFFKEHYNPVPAAMNKIKIRIKENYEQFVNQLEDVLGIIKIRNQYPDIQIESGKDLDGSEIGTNAEIDAEALISMDKIKEIAAEFITKKVNSSRVIAKDDKERVTKEIVRILNKELENFEHSTNSLNVIPLRLELSNFMALGDDNVIEFRNGITKLSGSNGTGKSTVFNAIKWMWTDMVYPSQKANYKKENALILFNNKRPDIDTVYGKMVQLVNGDEMTIEKTLTRSWKKNATAEDKISENWMDCCDMPTVECTVQYQDKTYENEEALKFLSNIFPSLSDITRTLFATAPSLFSIINTATNELNDEILYNLGLNFFETLADRYDGLRSSIMDNLSKPSFSEGELLAQIDCRTKTIEEELKPKIEATKIAISEQEQSAMDIKNNKTKLLLQLTNASDEQLQANIKEIEKYEAENRDLTAARATLKKNIDEATENYNQNEVSTKLPQLQELEQQISDKIAKTNNTIIELQAEVTKVSEAGSARQNDILDSVREEVNNLKTNLSDTEQLLQNEQNRLNTAEIAYKNNVSSAKQQSAAEIEIIRRDIQMLEYQNNQAKEKIVELEARNKKMLETDTCPTCGRKHTKESFEYANKELATNNQEIERLNELVDKNTCSITDKQLQIETKQNALKKMLQNFEAEFATIKTASETNIKAYNDKITAIKDKLAELKSTTIVKVKNDAKIQELIAKRQELEQRISVCKSDLPLTQSRLDETKKQISVLTQLEQVYKKDIAIWTERIESAKKQFALHLNLIEQLKEKNLHIEREIEANNKLKVQISELDKQLQDVENDIKTKTIEQNNLLVEVKTLERENESDKEDISAAIEWRIKDASMRIYKQIIGKNGLSTYIFSMIRPNLNAALNDMLSGLGFVLAFNEDNELKMIKLNDDKQIKQSVAFSSGMESTFLGLSLLYVLKTKNIAKKVNILFIDEVTGALNDGTDLSYEASNYQELFKNLLHKMKKQFNIFIIDHVIKNLEEDQRLEVVPGTDGAEIVQIF